LHSEHPNDGSDGNEDQRNDRLVASKRPESAESDGDGHCDGEPRPAPCEFGTFPSQTRVRPTASLRWVRVVQLPADSYFDPMRARTTAMTATNAMPMESTSGIGERGNG